jgi:hypothetical protein
VAALHNNERRASASPKSGTRITGDRQVLPGRGRKVRGSSTARGRGTGEATPNGEFSLGSPPSSGCRTMFRGETADHAGRVGSPGHRRDYATRAPTGLRDARDSASGPPSACSEVSAAPMTTC